MAAGFMGPVGAIISGGMALNKGLSNIFGSTDAMTTQDAILGSTLMTLINKASDQNEKNGVEKDKQNRYISNEENSIKIEVKFLESDKIYAMESISSLGSEAFIKNYNNMNFICTKKEYHEKTKYIKYMLFEQIKLDVNER